MKLDTKHMLWLIATCIAIFFVHLDAIPLNIMEARNFITAREMLLDDHWILTTINGEARYQKPPLPTWITAISASIFGLESLYALRLPAVLMAITSVLFFYKFTSSLVKNNTFGFVSSLILITSFFFTFAGRNGQWDIFTHGFIIMAIYWLYRFFSTSSKRYGNAVLAAICIGLSFMSKGPVSVYTLLLPFLIAYGISFGFGAFQKKWMPAILLFFVALILSGWWYLYVYIYDTENISKITTETANWSNYNVKPFYYYWSFFIQTGLWVLPALVSLLYPIFKDKVIHKKAYLLSFLWTLLAVVVLSIIPEKKQRYLLPVVIPFAINIGFYIEYLFHSFSKKCQLKFTAPAYVHFGAVALVGLLFPWVAGYYFWEALQDYFVWFLLLAVSVFCGGFYIVFHLYHKNIKKVFYASIFYVAASMTFGLPLIGILNTNPDTNTMAGLADWEETQQTKVFEYSAFTPEFLWQYGKKMQRIQPENLENELNQYANIALLVHEKALPNFLKDTRGYDVKVVNEFDINLVHKKDKKHNFRLHRYLYLVTAD